MKIFLIYHDPIQLMKQKGMITIFMLLLVNNVVQKTRTQVTNTISLYKLTNALLLLICFKLFMKSMKLC